MVCWNCDGDALEGPYSDDVWFCTGCGHTCRPGWTRFDHKQNLKVKERARAERKKKREMRNG